MNLLSFFLNSCLDMQKKSQKGKSTNVDSQTGQTTKRSKTSSGCPFKKANAIESVRDRALLQVQVFNEFYQKQKPINILPRLLIFRISNN